MKKPNPYVRAIIVPVRVNSEEMRELIKLAHAHPRARGKVSTFLRIAGLSFKKSKT